MSFISIPGNLLILGEYAVLEEGGLGLTMAIDPSVTAETVRADGFSLTGITPAETVHWHAETSGGATDGRPGERPSGEPDSLLAAAARELGRLLVEHTGVQLSQLGVRITIDSREFFTAAGRKRGYGSSAAVVAALVVSVLARARELAPVALDTFDPLAAAVAAHRAAQGGRGSGYDVAASLHGGVGLFYGGRQPRYEPLGHDVAWPRTLLSAGMAAVGTSPAIKRYQALRRENPQFVRAFVEASNRAVRQFVDAESWPAQRDAILAARRWSIQLGDAVGVSAHPPFPDLRHAIAKCLGAGDELVGWFVDPAATDELAGLYGAAAAAEVTPAFPQGWGIA